MISSGLYLCWGIKRRIDKEMLNFELIFTIFATNTMNAFVTMFTIQFINLII